MAVILRPHLEGAVELVDLDLVARLHIAFLPHEGSDRRGEVAHLSYRLLRARQPGEAIAVLDGQAVQTVERPVQDPGQLLLNALLEGEVLLAEPRVRQHQQNHAADDGGGCVTELGHLVGEDMQPAGQLPRPLVAELTIDGESVLTADRQQPLHHDGVIAAGEAGVSDNRQCFADQRR